MGRTRGERGKTHRSFAHPGADEARQHGGQHYTTCTMYALLMLMGNSLTTNRNTQATVGSRRLQSFVTATHHDKWSYPRLPPPPFPSSLHPLLPFTPAPFGITSLVVLSDLRRFSRIYALHYTLLLPTLHGVRRLRFLWTRQT